MITKVASAGLGLLSAIFPSVDKAIDDILPDSTDKTIVKAEIAKALIAQETEIRKAAMGVLQADASSKHWLAANWRPLTMLTLVGLLVAYWFGYSPSNMPESALVEIIQIIGTSLGIMGGGRTLEKILPNILTTLKR